MKQELKIGFKKLSFIEQIDENKSIYSQGKKFYLVEENNPELEKKAFNLKQLKKMGINCSKVVKYDKKANVLVTTKTEGQSILSILESGELDEEIFEKFFNIYRFCRFSKISLEFYPENFVLVGKNLVYNSYVFNLPDDKKTVEDYWLKYWFISEEFVKRYKDLKIDQKRILKKEEVNKKIVLTSIKYW